MTYTFYFQEIYEYFFVFMRLSGLFLFFPGIGESFVSPRIRLITAFVVTLVLAPLVSKGVPVKEFLSPLTVLYICREIFFGLFLGVMTRILLDALQTTGNIIGLHTSLSGASLLNPSLGTSDTAIGTVLMFGATALLFATNAHYLIFAGLVHSYEIFPMQGPVLIGDFSKAMVNVVADSFWLGVKLAFPVMIVGTLLNVSTGLVSRLMPQMQVYFMFMPVQVFLGFMLLAAIVSTIMIVFMDHFRNFLQGIGNG
jgi:flagellar biosynthetic protein FliR